MDTDHFSYKTFLALLETEKNKSFLDKSLSPIVKEIACGSIRRKLTLDYLIKKASSKGKLKIKLKEKILLRIAFYQQFFMKKPPTYAIVGEIMKIIKKYSHPRNYNFLYAILQKMKSLTFPEKKEDTLSTYFSYPQLFIEKIIKQYGKILAFYIFETMNTFSPIMLRYRKNFSKKKCFYKSKFTHISFLEKSKTIEDIKDDSNIYIQNFTPIYLLEKMCLSMKMKVTSVLDLCSAPGGKSIFLSDFFTLSKMVVNDVSNEKIQILKHNLQKYQISSEISLARAEEFSSEEKFDIVLIDVPCSNSGVFHKRSEARWRFSKENLDHLKKLQINIFLNALKLAGKNGRIFYMTCSILKEENEDIIDSIQNIVPVKIHYQQTVIPTLDGIDGGFGCSLSIL